MATLIIVTAGTAAVLAVYWPRPRRVPEFQSTMNALERAVTKAQS